MSTKSSTSTVRRPSGLVIATILLALSVIGSLWTILHYGVNLFDEALYVALPYRFALGDKPFIDELNLVQSASLITFPLIKLFTLFTTGTEGIILFTRKLYFVFELLVMFSIFRALRKELGWHWALLCSLLAIAFVPRGIPNLGYKSLSSGLLTMGVFLGFWLVPCAGTDRRKNLSLEILCGTALGLCCVANPAFSPLCLVYLSMLAFIPSKKNPRPLVAFVSIGILFVCIVGLFQLPQEISKIRLYHVVRGREWRTQSMMTIHVLLQVLTTHLPKKALLIGGTLAFLRFAVASEWGFFLVPLLAVVPFICGLGMHGYLGFYSVLAPLFYFELRQNPFYRNLLLWVWLPSAGAGMIAAFSSDNAMVNAAIGLLPAAVVTSVAVTLLIDCKKNQSQRAGLPVYSYIAVVTHAIALAILLGYSALPFLDKPIWLLNAKVDEGPYKGLFTTKQRRQCLRELSADLRAVQSSSGHVLFYAGEPMPFAYLLTKMRPVSPSVWDCPLTNQFCYKYYQPKQAPDDVIVKMIRGFCSEDAFNYSEPDPFVKLMDTSKQAMITRPNYIIYGRQ